MLFTRCPDCETTFRITAEALRKADGQVRCGRCACVFNAYNELRRRARRNAGAKREEAIAAGQSVPHDATRQDSRNAAAQVARDAKRDHAQDGKRDHPQDGKPPAAPAQSDPAAESDARAALAGVTPASPSSKPRAARATGRAAPGAAAKASEDEKDVVVGDISLAGVIADLKASVAPDEGDALIAEESDAAATDISAITLLAKNGLNRAVDAKVASAASMAAIGSTADAAEVASVDAAKVVSADAAEVASTDAAEGAGAGTDSATPAWVILDEARPKRLAAARVWTAGCVAAGALLALQVLHHNRADIAVLGVVGPVVQEAYATLGSEIAPDWDLGQYEIVVDWDAVTQPSTDGRGELKIVARIRNKGPRALPLPQVQVQLKDRWESTIGSRVFAPSEYLPSGAALDRMMIAGQTMLAELAILDPGSQAYGFELDVCVDAQAGALRCAADEVFR